MRATFEGNLGNASVETTISQISNDDFQVTVKTNDLGTFDDEGRWRYLFGETVILYLRADDAIALARKILEHVPMRILTADEVTAVLDS